MTTFDSPKTMPDHDVMATTIILGAARESLIPLSPVRHAVERLFEKRPLGSNLTSRQRKPFHDGIRNYLRTRPMTDFDVPSDDFEQFLEVHFGFTPELSSRITAAMTTNALARHNMDGESAVNVYEKRKTEYLIDLSMCEFRARPERYANAIFGIVNEGMRIATLNPEQCTDEDLDFIALLEKIGPTLPITLRSLKDTEGVCPLDRIIATLLSDENKAHTLEYSEQLQDFFAAIDINDMIESIAIKETQKSCILAKRHLTKGENTFAGIDLWQGLADNEKYVEALINSGERAFSQDRSGSYLIHLLAANDFTDDVDLRVARGVIGTITEGMGTKPLIGKNGRDPDALRHKELERMIATIDSVGAHNIRPAVLTAIKEMIPERHHPALATAMQSGRGH